VCSKHVTPPVVAEIKAAAELLAPLLVRADAEVGVTSTQLYDGKLALSYLALRARGATGAQCAVFGLSADGSGIVDRPLVRELIFVLMSLHLPRRQRHVPATPDLEAKVAAAIDALRRPEILKGCTLMLCDTGEMLTRCSRGDVAEV